LSGSDADRDIAKDLLSSLLTQRQGEYIIRIGQQPPHTKLFSDELADECEGWSGASRTHDEIDKLRTAIIETVEEIGGKVRFSFGVAYPPTYSPQASVLHENRGARSRLTLLLRLLPHSVSSTPEVRCAVVGNVDSGKSTTLGVLTRGTFP
jgi:hypothetical protein